MFDVQLLEKYNKSGPRYTSYPTANNFHTISADDYVQQIHIANANEQELSLYVHIPFCDTVCFYCGCNKIATKDKSKNTPYLAHLYKEIDLQAELFSAQKIVRQCHFGGGTPTFLTPAELSALVAHLRLRFHFADDAEVSIEIDPRSVDDEYLHTIRAAGFNRLSLGVQDFDENVQTAVNRTQSVELVTEVVRSARKYEFLSISFDLIYGLPQQSLESFRTTLAQVIAIKPDRISLFNYAHLPDLFKPQRRINEEELPNVQEKLAILGYSIDALCAAGYIYIGMDHFALPEDELAKAQQQGTLHRNFQGYATFKDCDMIGFGVSSIAQVGNIFAQNYKTLEEYYQALDNNILPIAKGKLINADDIVRRRVIMQLICNFNLEFSTIEQEFAIDFQEYFADELKALKEFIADGFLSITAHNITIYNQGKFFIRLICMVFDAYLSQSSSTRFSKVL